MIEWKAVARGGVAVSPKAHSSSCGNIGTCPLLNKKVSRHCPRIEVQSKETLMGPGVQPGPWYGWQLRYEEASLRGKGAGTLPGLA